MSLREIPWQEWAEFAETFGRQHENWLATLEVERSGTEAASAGDAPAVGVLTREQPLRGFAYLNTGSHDEFWLAIGDEPDEKIHKAGDPVRVVFETDERLAHRGLRIESASGETISLRFRAASLPEELDGLP